MSSCLVDGIAQLASLVEDVDPDCATGARFERAVLDSERVEVRADLFHAPARNIDGVDRIRPAFFGDEEQDGLLGGLVAEQGGNVTHLIEIVGSHPNDERVFRAFRQVTNSIAYVAAVVNVVDDVISHLLIGPVPFGPERLDGVREGRALLDIGADKSLSYRRQPGAGTVPAARTAVGAMLVKAGSPADRRAG